MSRRAATLAVTGQHRGESASTSVGRGIPDAPMAQFVRGRQGCRPLRCCWSMVHTSGGTHRSRPTSIVGGAFVLMGWQMVPAVHPHRGRRWGPWPLAGIATSADGAWGTLGGRPLRRAGVSRRARRGYFVRCGGRPKTLPLETAIFFKKSSKNFYLFSHYRQIAKQGALQTRLQCAAQWNPYLDKEASMASAAFYQRPWPE